MMDNLLAGEQVVEYRIEQDSLGEVRVPKDAYYGSQTVRALENFPITRVPISHFPKLIIAIATIKEAAAAANAGLGLLEPSIAKAIIKATEEIRSGRLHDQFVIDVIQGGAGTSTNMNANEVIANRALEHIGLQRGTYEFCHPNDHVNLSQSTNDVYPTAIKLATIWQTQDLIKSMEYLKDAFNEKSQEFEGILKIGRTQLQDAVPMTLGQEFGAYAETIYEDVQRLHEALPLLYEINLGATAIGTGINTVSGYADQIRESLIELVAIPIVTSRNLVEATSDAGVFVQISGILKRISVKISKICNDLRLLSSGPRAGLGEIHLPPVQPGSSIMPGKVNPVIPEMVNQVCFQVIGNDLTITMAAAAGQLELNAFEPIIALNLFESLQILERALLILSDRCIRGIQGDERRCRRYVDESIGLATALIPYIGYKRASEVAFEALEKGISVKQLCIQLDILTDPDLDGILDPKNMMRPRQSHRCLTVIDTIR